MPPVPAAEASATRKQRNHGLRRKASESPRRLACPTRLAPHTPALAGRLVRSRRDVADIATASISAGKSPSRTEGKRIPHSPRPYPRSSKTRPRDLERQRSQALRTLPCRARQSRSGSVEAPVRLHGRHRPGFVARMRCPRTQAEQQQRSWPSGSSRPSPTHSPPKRLADGSRYHSALRPQRAARRADAGRHEEAPPWLISGRPISRRISRDRSLNAELHP